jgi:hypothetical protein
MLRKCYTLNFTACRITDEGVKMLGKCHTLNLYCCDEITDESVKMLGKSNPYRVMPRSKASSITCPERNKVTGVGLARISVPREQVDGVIVIHLIFLIVIT